MPIANAFADLAPMMREWRRDFHAHPELGKHEFRTARRVAELLRSFGVDEVHEGIGGTGVVGVLHGAQGAASGESDTILLRADMDALPITESNEFVHKSQNQGIMHACGHDGHTTMLLGAAKRLAETRNFRGTVVLCFQPAEEGHAGAKMMIEDGLFTRFPCRAIYAMHNWPGYEVGYGMVLAGPVMAAAGVFEIEITGRGGHAAHPYQARDPIVAGAQIITALQSVVSRRVPPLEPAVLSITQFKAGSAYNVIPETATLSGTFRSFDNDINEIVRQGLEEIVSHIATAMRVRINITYPQESYPATINDPEQSEFVREVMTEILGEANVSSSPPQTMGGEDFSFMLQQKPGCYFFVGNGFGPSLHHPAYDFNDELAPIGAALFTEIAQKALPLE